MITGVIANRRATVLLLVRGPDGREAEIEARLDTGFSGYLSLPGTAVAALALTYAHPMRGRLADGSRVTFQVYTATVLWDGVERDTDVLATGTDALLGMSLLEGSNVNLQVRDGGAVTIRPL